MLVRHAIVFSFSGDDQSNNNAVETERSFVCRMKCILNTSAGFFKVKYSMHRKTQNMLFVSPINRCWYEA